MEQLTGDDRVELYLGRAILPRLNKIETGLELLNNRLGNLSDQIKYQAEDQKEINADVKKHEKILSGNGEEGLVALVLHIKSWIEEQKKFQWFITTSAITTLIGIIVTIGYVILHIK